MGCNDGSCARTRGWHRESKNSRRFHFEQSPSSDSEMSFDLVAGRSDEFSGDGRFPQPSVMEKQLRNLRVSSKVSRIVEEKSNDMPVPIEEKSKGESRARGERNTGVEKDRNVLEGVKSRPEKYKDEQKRKEKNHDKDTKSKEKNKDRDKHSEKDRKEHKRKNEHNEKKSHDRHKKLEKPQKGGKDYENDGHRKDRYRGDNSERIERDHARGTRYEDQAESLDRDSRHRDRHHESSKHNSSKTSSKSDRERDSKRSRHEGEQRSTTNKSVRSPSPPHKEKDEKDRSGRDRAEKDSSGRYRRSGLGGYSPRRRRSEAAIKTPSPPPRSPERKKARAWDLPPAGMDSGVAAAMAAAHQVAAQQAAALASVSSLTTVTPALATVSLTQATRNLRRLYIGNIPSTVSEGELTEFINAAMLSVNANHIPGTKPCINCMVNVEKSYAFAEFLTAEDATAGLAFDGITLHGTTLKIRRPRDYVPPSSGGLEYASAVDMVSSVVPDSPHKIFVGGICKTLSADKVKEIVTAFGQLKAYHWEEIVENNHKETFAFFEYLDPSITLKACAGLNGMRLGNEIITVVQATPNATLEDAKKDNPFYGIPELAKPLLQTPTRILEFQNVISEEEAVILSEAELLEIEEDVCLECKRFGTVKSIHVVKREMIRDHVTGEADSGDHAENKVLEAGNAYTTEEEKKFVEYFASVVHGVSGIGEAIHTNQETSSSKMQSSVDEAERIPSSTVDDEKLVSEETAQANDGRDSMEMTGSADGNVESISPVVETKLSVAEDGGKDVQEESEAKVVDTGKPSSDGIEIDEDDTKNLYPEEGNLGRVYVEFTREETACQAAHVLHGRLYGERKVMVSYFPVKLYQKRFGKGLEPRTHEEKQALALAAQEHLNTYLPERD